MAKRVSQDERPYRPVQEALVRAVMSQDVQELGTETADPESEGPGTEPLDGTLAEASEGHQAAAQLPAVEKLSREKRVLLSPSEEREVEQVVARIAGELGTPVKLSHMLRAYMTLLIHAENEILQRARQSPPLRRPPNGDPVALASFEQGLAHILSSALREAPTLR